MVEQSDPVGVLSAIATVISIIDVLGRGMHELYMARERHQDVPKVMSSHCEELFNIKNILHVVQQQEILQLGSILEDLDQLHQHGKNLQRTLRKFGKERGQFQGLAHQLLHGKRSLDELNEIMGKLGRAKANISLKIQVAHVGLTRSLGEVIVVNCERTEALGMKLEELLNAGNGSRIAGLRIAGLLQSNERHSECSHPTYWAILCRGEHDGLIWEWMSQCARGMQKLPLSLIMAVWRSANKTIHLERGRRSRWTTTEQSPGHFSSIAQLALKASSRLTM